MPNLKDQIIWENDKLPKGWTKTTIGNIAKINPGINILSLPDATSVSFVPMSAVEAGTGKMDASQMRTIGEVKRGYTAFLENDILFAKITPCMENGKFAVAQGLSSGIGFGSTEFHILRPEKGINPHLLYYYLSQEEFKLAARATMFGSVGYLRVPATFLGSALYPLAPTEEQNRIVAVIEQQFTRIDNAVVSLQNAQIKTIQYRASLLKLAMEGELTKEWRTKYSANEKTGSNLLAGILDERRALWEIGQLTKMSEKGIVPKDDKWKQAYKEPQGPNMESLPSLPEGWCWATVEQLADVSTGVTPLRSRSEYYEGGTIPLVTSASINAEFLTSTEDYVTKKALEETNIKIFPKGSLILVMHGENKARGNVSELKIDAATNQACAAVVFRPYAFSCQPYLKYLFTKNYYTMRTFIGNNTRLKFNLNLTLLREMVVPLPPLAEQAQIVAEIEAHLSDIEQIEKIIGKSLIQAEKERRSILREAFAGRLVSQNDTDEPVNLLLERINKKRKKDLEIGRKPPRGKIQENLTQEIRNHQEKAGKRYLGLYEKLVARPQPVSPAELFKQVELDIDDNSEKIETFYNELAYNEEKGLVIEERIEDYKVVIRATKPTKE